MSKINKKKVLTLVLAWLLCFTSIVPTVSSISSVSFAATQKQKIVKLTSEYTDNPWILKQLANYPANLAAKYNLKGKLNYDQLNMAICAMYANLYTSPTAESMYTYNKIAEFVVPAQFGVEVKTQDFFNIYCSNELTTLTKHDLESYTNSCNRNNLFLWTPEYAFKEIYKKMKWDVTVHDFGTEIFASCAYQSALAEGEEAISIFSFGANTIMYNDDTYSEMYGLPSLGESDYLYAGVGSSIALMYYYTMINTNSDTYYPVEQDFPVSEESMYFYVFADGQFDQMKWAIPGSDKTFKKFMTAEGMADMERQVARAYSGYYDKDQPEGEETFEVVEPEDDGEYNFLEGYGF